MTFIALINELIAARKSVRYVLKSGYEITGYAVSVSNGMMSVDTSGKLSAHVDVSQIAAIEYP